MRPKTLGVIGLGAMGGSVALQAARAGVLRVVGYASSPKDRAAAARAGAVTEVAHDPAGVVHGADLVVLAAPPLATLGLLSSLADHLRERGALCTDVTSVKGPVVAEARKWDLASVFAGSHPFVGTHRSGFSAAHADRFTNAIVYVTPVEGGDRAAQEVADFWTRVMGAQPVTISAAQHDERLAWTSHLPQAVASALAAALAARGPSGAAYGRGALDTTRLAGSSVDMWTDVLLMNRDQILAALNGAQESLDELKTALKAGDGAALGRWLESGARWRSRFET